MPKIFTICFLIISFPVFLHNNEIDSLQQKHSQAKGSEKILVLNKKNKTTAEKLQVKFEISKKDQQIKLDRTIIKNKNLILCYSLGAGGILLIALIFIIVLYRKRNKAYKKLVYRSLNIVGKNHSESDKEVVIECDENDISGYQNTIDEVLKQRIINALDCQLTSKIYLFPGLSIKNLSDKCGTNSSYLSQIIHEKYQMNFNTFINKYRIEEARQILIKQGDKIPLKTLYERMGFSSYTRFHETFKKHTGVTPSFFLKTVKEL